MTKPLIIYHGPGCMDGSAVALAAWLKFGDEAEYRPAQYGDPAPTDDEVRGRDVYVLDFSYSRAELMRMRNTQEVTENREVRDRDQPRWRHAGRPRGRYGRGAVRGHARCTRPTRVRGRRRGPVGCNREELDCRRRRGDEAGDGEVMTKPHQYRCAMLSHAVTQEWIEVNLLDEKSVFVRQPKKLISGQKGNALLKLLFCPFCGARL